ncbi:MAG: hypothetical protein EXS37_14605 [Opitutus sp.]|nr:hypothetical protein [Opitutus sp.]
MKVKSRLAPYTAALAITILGQAGLAQVAPAPRPGTKAAVETNKTETTVLGAFEVVSDPVGTYEAVNFSSLTGSNKPLAKLPVTAEILTEQALSDLAVSNAVDIFRDYATGLGAPYNSAGAANQAGGAGDNVIPGNIKLRGLAAGRPLRNGFIDAEGTMMEGLNIGRVEIIRGPQALIYGPGTAGGVLNIVTKRASFGSNKGALDLRTDNNGSLRTTFDGNFSKPILGHRAAIRTVAAKDNSNLWRKNLGQDTRAYFIEGGIELFKSSATTLRLEFEDVYSEKLFSGGSTITNMPTVAPNNTLARLLLAEGNPALSRVYNGRLNWENVDSFGTTSNGRWDNHQYYGATLSSKITPWLQAQVMAGRDIIDFSTLIANNYALREPSIGGNPLNEWAISVTWGGPKVRSQRDAVRATFTADFNLTRFTKNNLVFGGDYKDRIESNYQRSFYELDANGNFIVTPALLNNATGGRNAMPAEWIGVEHGLGGPIHLRDLVYKHSNGRTYRRDFARTQVPAFVTPANPQGWSGGAFGSDNIGRDRGAFAALLTEWVGGKFDTMASVRVDETTSLERTTGVRTTYPFKGTNAYNLGAVWHARPWLSPYYGWSTRKKLQGGLDIRRDPLPLGEGESSEYGVKFSAFEGRLSGAAAYFRNTAKAEAAIIDNPTLNVVDPNSFINGQYSSGARMSFDPVSTGYEVTLTAQPARNWRLQIGYSYSTGEQGGDVVLPIFYNDNFRTNAAGQVTLADGTPLRVPIDRTVPIANDGRTYPATVATQILTVNTLRNGDANGNYRAQLDTANGRILNAVALGLTVPGVGTGITGLPIRDHQLGFVAPTGDTFLARKGGDRLIGGPRHSFNILSMYRFAEGMFRGTSVGFNAQYRQGENAYYYTDLADGGKRKLLSFPDSATVGLIAGYERKVTRKIAWRIQLNVNNVLDEQQLRFYPNLANGTAFNAVLIGTPRTYIVTNSFSF